MSKFAITSWLRNCRERAKMIFLWRMGIWGLPINASVHAFQTLSALRSALFRRD